MCVSASAVSLHLGSLLHHANLHLDARVYRLAEVESQALADAAQAQHAAAAHEASVQALKKQFRAYQAAKAEEITTLEARLRRTLGISGSPHRSKRR